MESIDKITITEVRDKHRQNKSNFTCLILNYRIKRTTSISIFWKL